MKRLLYISNLLAVFLLTVGMFQSANAQDHNAVFSKIATAIQKADHEALGALFHTTVEVTVPSADDAYSAKQAAFVLKEFFANHAPKSFKIVHKGESGSTFYATGVFVSNKSEFDSNIFLKKFGDKFLITQIRFEEE